MPIGDPPTISGPDFIWGQLAAGWLFAARLAITPVPT
jgi:hypothetical protein